MTCNMLGLRYTDVNRKGLVAYRSALKARPHKKTASTIFQNIGMLPEYSRPAGMRRHWAQEATHQATDAGLRCGSAASHRLHNSCFFITKNIPRLTDNYKTDASHNPSGCPCLPRDRGMLHASELQRRPHHWFQHHHPRPTQLTLGTFTQPKNCHTTCSQSACNTVLIASVRVLTLLMRCSHRQGHKSIYRHRGLP